MNYLKYIIEKQHTVIFATISNNKPYTCAIDLMDYDQDGLYFLTAKGKNFYKRLKENPYISFTGVQGETTLRSIAISVQAKAIEVGPAYLDQLLKKNPYMYEIYPTKQSLQNLTVFKIIEGTGEYFDLSKKPIERACFSFGKEVETHGYFINHLCTNCKKCLDVCPQQCIDLKNKQIIQANCLYCGNCLSICPYHAIKRK